MKTLTLTTLFILAFSCTQAQDTIKFTNGNILAAKILEINQSTVKYKPLNNPDGPDYIDEKSRISFIKYANGLVDTIKIVKEEKPVQTSIELIPTLKPLPPKYSKIGMIGSRYFFVDESNQRISRGLGINKILKTANALASEKQIQPLKDLTRKTNTSKKLQTIFGIAGAPAIVVGLATTFVGFIVAASSYNATERSDGENLALSGATIATIGIGFEITSIVNGGIKKKRLKQTIDLYNQNL